MNGFEVREFLHQKNWRDTDEDWRFVNSYHPYVIITSGEAGQITLREAGEPDNGQNGEEIFSFQSVNELQEWFENNIGE